jgi:hypothetical protein
VTIDLKSEIVNQITHLCEFELCYVKEDTDCLVADCDVFLIEIYGGFHIECSWIDEEKKFLTRLTKNNFSDCIADRFSLSLPLALLDLKELIGLLFERKDSNEP